LGSASSDQVGAEQEESTMDLCFPRPSSIRFLILSCAISTAGFELIATPARAQNAEDSSFSRCDQKKTLHDYWEELKANPRSSLANYCEGELLFAQRNYQASINAYHASLSGDGVPNWTKVWSHIQFGKINDIVGERERAVEHYRLAIRTGDNTGNAMERARDLLQHPFELPMKH
jgi:tetratricopeptide (TPR) repeat protein